ncbi:MAG: phage tail tape measure protein [Catenulispora sp.]|nr:phage tail tape measure protein [Catenulispora sp.]
MSSERIALDAGLAPVGTVGGEPITARRYHHPLLGSRPVVRLCGDADGPGEDRVLAAAGFSAPEVGAPVSAGHRREPGYPAWAVIHDPVNAGIAVDAAAEMERAEQLARPKPGPALDIYHAVAATLPAGHLPAFWEQVGRVFIAAGRLRQGAMMFGKARAAESQAGVVDPVRRRAVFLEFALAGALSVKDIKAYVADLGQGADPAESYRELRELAVRRTLGGLPPWPDMLKQLAKLAKAAGLDVATEHARVLEELLDAPALWRAADGFWTSQRKTWLAALAGSSAEVKRRLAWQLTDLPYSEMDAWWVSFLDEVGAFDDLGDGTAGWLAIMLRRYRGPDRWSPKAPTELLNLLPRLAERIGREAEPLRFDTGGGNSSERYRVDAAVIGGCLTAGIPVADPDRNLLLAHWRDHDRFSLEALTSDDRFAPALTESILEDKGHEDRWQAEWAMKPLRPFLRGIVEDRMREAASGPLTSALDAFDWLYNTLSRQAVQQMPDLPARLAGIDLVTPLTRTLRAGIFDELGWDALDAAGRELGRKSWCRPSWPLLTVHNRGKAIVVGPRTRIMEHQLTVPRGANQFSYDVRVYFSGGQLLVFHVVNGTRTEYWSGAPQQIVTETNHTWRWWYAEEATTGYVFLGPGEQRFVGHRLLAVGDRLTDSDRHMFHDGRTFWCATGKGAGYRVRPVNVLTGELGEPDLPAFLDRSLLDADEQWLAEPSSLAPAAPGAAPSPLGTDGVHLGFRVAHNRRTGEVRYHRIDGVHGRVPTPSRRAATWGLLDMPGTDGRLLLDIGNRYHTRCVTARDPQTGEAYWRVSMLDPDHHVMDSPDPMASGTMCLPPQAFWHFLTPRDLPGSRALRGISEASARVLLKAAATSEAAVREAVGSVLPEVSHPLLVDGIVGMVRYAARRIPDRNKLLRVLEQVPGRPLKVPEPDLDGALEGLVSQFYEGHGGTARQIEVAEAFFTGAIDGQTAMTHWGIHQSRSDWTELAGRIGGLAVRAVSAVTPARHRAALIELLRFWASSPLADPGLHRGLLDHRSPAALDTAEGKLLPLDIAMHCGRWSRSHDRDNHTTKAFLQRGDMPRPDGFVDVRPVPSGWATPKRLRLLADLLKKRAPVPFDSQAAAHLAKAAELDYAEAALLLTGLPGVPDQGIATDNPLGTHIRTALGLKVTEADTAREWWWQVPSTDRLALYDAAMPGNPEELWDPLAMAARLAQAWRQGVPAT